MVGFSYLISLDIAFGIWLFYLLGTLEQGIFNILGIAQYGEARHIRYGFAHYCASRHGSLHRLGAGEPVGSLEGICGMYLTRRSGGIRPSMIHKSCCRTAPQCSA